MYITSNGYKQKIYSGDARHRLKLSFLPNTSTDFADLYCEKLTVKQRILPNGGQSFTLDNFMSTEAELILHKIDISNVPTEFDIELGTLVDNAYEYVPIGHFITSDKPTTDKDKTTFKLYDNAIKFDFNYNGEPLINEKKSQGLQGATKLEVLQDICMKAGVETEISSFLHSTDIVATYDNTITARAYISYLAEQSGAIAKIDRSGKLIFIYLNNLDTVRIPLSIVEKYSLGKPYEIGRVVYEDGVRPYKYPQEEVENKDTLFINASNPYIVSQEQITSVYGLVNGFKIDVLNTGKVLGDPAIDPYDLIEIYNDRSLEQETIAKSLATYTLTYNGKCISTYDIQIGEQTRKENISLKQAGTEALKRYVRTEIDEVNGTVNFLAGEVHGEDGNGGLVGQVADLEFSMNGLELNVKKSGTNLLMGTEFYDLSQWGGLGYYIIYEGVDNPNSKEYKYWYNPDTETVYESDDWTYAGITPITHNWTATNYTRKEIQEYEVTIANIIENEETKSNFVSGRAVQIGRIGQQPVNIDHTKGYITLSFKCKQLIENAKLHFEVNVINWADPSWYKHMSDIYVVADKIEFDNSDYKEYSITIPTTFEIIEAVYSSTTPQDTNVYWLYSPDISVEGIKLYKYDIENEEWVVDNTPKIVHTDLSDIGESNDTYLIPVKLWASPDNYYVQPVEETEYQDFIARSIIIDFDGEVDGSQEPLIENSVLIGDIKLEYGTNATVWENNMNEVFGKNYKMDATGFEINSNGYLMHIDEDEVTGSYQNEIQFQLNKYNTYSKNGKFITTDQNGLITQKLTNGIYVRYIK